MDPGVARAPGAIFKQLCQAFKLAGCWGAWWRATNGILQGCPLSVILVNVLTKWEVDALKEQVCVATVALPPAPAAAETNIELDQASQGNNPAEASELHVQLQAKGWRPRGRQAMPTTPRQWRRARRPSTGPPPSRRRGLP